MRISDWSSDVCSSDLAAPSCRPHGPRKRVEGHDDQLSSPYYYVYSIRVNVAAASIWAVAGCQGDRKDSDAGAVVCIRHADRERQGRWNPLSDDAPRRADGRGDRARFG